MRYKQLDALRGLAALTVFFSHIMGIYNFNSSAFTIITHSPLHIFYDGAAAVIFFFLLSGFVLSLPYLHSDKKISLFSFYFKRFFRIYPAFIAALLLAVILKQFLFEAGNMKEYSDWVQSFWKWNMDRKNGIEILKSMLLIGPQFNKDLIDPVIWSLIVEMKVSLLMPFFIYFISKTDIISNIALFICFLFFNKTHYSAIFLAGIILAKYRFIMISFFQKQHYISIVVLLLSGMILYTSRYTFRIDISENMLTNQLIDFCILAGSTIFIFISLSISSVSAFLQKKLFIFLGDISYSFYLIHLPILIVCCSVFSSVYILNYSLIFLMGITASFILSKCFFHCIELPFQKFATDFSKKYSFFNAVRF